MKSLVTKEELKTIWVFVFLGPETSAPVSALDPSAPALKYLSLQFQGWYDQD